MTTAHSSTAWQKTVMSVAMLAFSCFVLWMTASHFDASEMKTILGLSVGLVTREFLPEVLKAFRGMTSLFAEGGQVE